MTQDDLNQIIEETSDAKNRIEELIKKAKQIVEQKNKVMQKEEHIAQADGVLNIATEGNRLGPLGRERAKHKEKADEIEKNITKAEAETIPRFERELSKIEDGERELAKMQSALEDILTRANGWRNSLQEVIRAVESESINFD